jgi:NAD(P)-dependent dehydrogenase (short-subunit alcohol dehydrogenase family)
VAQLFASFDQTIGTQGRLAGLVNNAGIVASAARVDEMDWMRSERLLKVNTLGALACAREAVRRMSTRHGGSGGSIVNVSSAASRLGSPGQYVDYAMSKAALEAMSLGLAKEVAAEGIRVNAVRPGLIDTEIHASGGDPGRLERLVSSVPMRRSGSAHEVAEAIVWLLSDASSYCTASILDVTGGR